MKDAFWRGRRVLITGHTGFKGAWLAYWLVRNGADVLGWSLAPEPSRNLHDALRAGDLFDSRFADIRDTAALAAALRQHGTDTVFHLAAQALVLPSYAFPVETFSTNVVGTASVLEAVRTAPNVRAAVVVTSDKCYENRESQRPYRESDPLGGHDPYSASKGAAELVVASFRRSFLAAAGVNIASARAGNVIGGGDYSELRLVPDIVRAFEGDRVLVVRHPHATRPWQHVLEPLRGYLSLAERLLTESSYDEAWNFGPDPANVATVTDIIRLAEAVWQTALTLETPPSPGAHEAGLLRLDIEKARDRLGWSPQFSVAETIEMTMAWYRDFADGAAARDLLDRDIHRYIATTKGRS